MASVKLLDRLVKIGYNASTKQGNPGHEVPGCPPYRVTARNRRSRRTGPGEWTGTDCPAERGVTGCKPPTEAIRRRSPGSWLADGRAVGQPGHARYSSRAGGSLIGYQLLSSRVVPRKVTPFVLVDEGGLCISCRAFRTGTGGRVGRESDIFGTSRHNSRTDRDVAAGGIIAGGHPQWFRWQPVRHP